LIFTEFTKSFVWSCFRFRISSSFNC